MIDLKLLRDDPERVRESQRARGEDPALVDALLAADEARRTAVSRADTLRAEQKSVSASVRSLGLDLIMALPPFDGGRHARRIEKIELDEAKSHADPHEDAK